MIKETAKVFELGISHDVPEEMKEYLKKDAFIFSGLKTNAQLQEARSLLRDENGHIRPYYLFEKDILKLNEKYNLNYLDAEYQFAQSSSQSAANWANLSDSDRYNLQYRTAGDEKVRESHVGLNGTTLPKSSAFWISYYPPNGWRCRCIAVLVLASKYPASDVDKATAAAEKATTHIGKNGKNKLEMFRFNPGMQEKIFPPNNSYTKVIGAKETKKIVSKVNTLKTTKDLSNHISEFAEENKEFFHRGFKEVKTTSQRGVNGFTDMNGSISLKKEIVDHINAGINNIKNKIPTTFEQERAISTLHHEMWHNANIPGNMRMTTEMTKTMELANEFVSRKTLPEFMEKLGGKLENISLVNDRNNTAYNRMVVNYDNLIKWSGSNQKKVLETVKKSLVNDKYTDQITGLAKAIFENSTYEIEERSVRALISYATKNDYTEEKFLELLEKNKNLLKDR